MFIFGKKEGTALVILLLAIAVASAHQPRIVFNTNSSEQNPIIVKDPEVSKAYYGNLRGRPDYYKIVSDIPFKLYMNVLIPDVKGYDKKDFYVEVTDANNGEVLLLNGSAYEWKPFYEEYGGDNYVMGPDARAAMTEGAYYLKVYSPENEGRYSLAIGEEESFPPGEIINALIIVPQIKQQFFGKSIIEAYSNTTGLVIIVIVAIILITPALVLRLRQETQEK